MALTLNDHIGEVKDREHRRGLLKLCADTREVTGAEVGEARLSTNQELNGALGRHCNNVIYLNEERLLRNKEQLAEAAITSIHEGLHARGKRKLGKNKKKREGKGMKHEGVVELTAQEEATRLGYRGFSHVYERPVEGARAMAKLITFDRMTELADQENASVLLQRELTRALIKKHSMPPKRARERAKEMEKAAA